MNGVVSRNGERRPWSVLVVDDHELVRSALVMVLRKEGVAAFGCKVSAVEAIVAEAERHPPGLVLLDLNLGIGRNGASISGVDAVRPLRARGWSVLVVSGGQSRAQIAAAIAAGAIGEVSKSQPLPALVRTVMDITAGRVVLTQEKREAWLALDRQYRAAAARRRARLARLSTRERAVLERLVQGHRAAAIADEFVVSLTTVRTQIRSILGKLEVGSQLEAVALAQQDRAW